MDLLKYVRTVLDPVVNGVSSQVYHLSGGYALPRSFEIRGTRISCPSHFSSQDQRRAFYEVGYFLNYSSDRPQRCVEWFLDERLEEHMKDGGYPVIPLAVWHQVLDYYAAQGILERKYFLYALSNKRTMISPHWDIDGELFSKNRLSFVMQYGRVKELTEDQRRAVVGKMYAVCPKSDLREGQLMERFLVKKKHMKPIYCWATSKFS